MSVDNKSIKVERDLKTLNDKFKTYLFEIIDMKFGSNNIYHDNLTLFLTNIFNKLESNLEFSRNTKVSKNIIKEEIDMQIGKENIKLIQDIQMEIDTINNNFKDKDYDNLLSLIDEEIISPDQLNKSHIYEELSEKLLSKEKLISNDNEKLEYTYKEKLDEVIPQTILRLNFLKDKLNEKIIEINETNVYINTIMSNIDYIKESIKHLN